MTTFRRILGTSLLLASAITFSGCQHHYKGYYRNYWRLPSHSSNSNTARNSSSAPSQSRTPTSDPFYAQQAAKREANLRAGQQLQQQHQMDSYKRGYTNKLPGQY